MRLKVTFELTVSDGMPLNYLRSMTDALTQMGGIKSAHLRHATILLDSAARGLIPVPAGAMEDDGE